MSARKLGKQTVSGQMPDDFNGDTDLANTEGFLSLLDPAGKFTFQSIDDDRVRNDINLNRVLYGLFSQHKEELVELNARGAGIHVLINRSNGNVCAGKKNCVGNKNIVAVRAAFVSIDKSNLKDLVNNGLDATLMVGISPTFLNITITVIVSRTQCDLYWVTEQCPLEEFGSIQQRLAKLFKGKRTLHELSTVMRLPGFINHKAGILTLSYVMDESE
jgi:hypothetical protein